MNLDVSLALTDGSLIVVNSEGLICRGQDVNFVGLRFDAQVIVTSIMPTSAIQAWHGFTRSEFRKRRWSLEIAIEMIVIDRGHPRIVEVTGPVPDLVLLPHSHVTHLHRQKILKRRLPYSILVNIRSDAKRFSSKIAVFNCVDTWPRYATKIKMKILVPEESSPGCRCFGKHLLGSPGFRYSIQMNRGDLII